MRSIIIIIVAMFFPLAIFARERLKSKMLTGTHHAYADVGTKSSISLTYNYNLSRHWGWGAGVQGGSWNPGYADDHRYMSGIFGDMHFTIRPQKHNQFFSFVDLGMDFYKRDKRYFRDSVVLYDLSDKNGMYTALGFGYLRRMTKRGGGLYVSLRLVLDIYKVRVYSFISDDKNTTAIWGDGTAVLSIGFKF